MLVHFLVLEEAASPGRSVGREGEYGGDGRKSCWIPSTQWIFVLCSKMLRALLVATNALLASLLFLFHIMSHLLVPFISPCACHCFQLPSPWRDWYCITKSKDEVGLLKINRSLGPWFYCCSWIEEPHPLIVMPGLRHYLFFQRLSMCSGLGDGHRMNELLSYWMGMFSCIVTVMTSITHVWNSWSFCWEIWCNYWSNTAINHSLSMEIECFEYFLVGITI